MKESKSDIELVLKCLLAVVTSVGWASVSDDALLRSFEQI